MKKISFQKKIQVWDLIGALIPHLYFFFEMKFFFISKNFTSVESATCNFFLEKVWDIAKFRKNQGKND